MPADSVLIYPTPTKQDKSIGVPYVDLFREFQNKLLEPHSVLFVIGYSFSDRHVNEIIYRALATNSTINIVIFSEMPNESDREKKPIYFINDNRVFTVYGKDNGQNIHYFEYFVNTLLPNIDDFKKDDAVLTKFIESLKAGKKSNENR